MNTIQLIIFDWDGTLIDSVARIVRCFEETYRSFDLTPADADTIKSTIGLPLTESFYKLVPEDSSITQPEWVSAYRQVWLEEGRLALSPLFDGVPQLLEELSLRYEMCIATGKSRAGLERELNHYGIAHYFREQRCANETKPKPDPEMLFQLLDAYQVSPGEAIMIGDSTLDIEMGNAAGMPTIAVTSGGQSAEILRGVNPSAMFNSVCDIRQQLLT